MRIRNLYDPPTLKDHAPVVPWTADGVTASSKTTDEGLEILIHVGIDTVEMKGEGFSSAVQMGDRVVAGQELLRFDPALVRAKAPSALTPVVLTTMPLVESFRAAQGMVTAGNDVLLSVVLKPLA